MKGFGLFGGCIHLMKHLSAVGRIFFAVAVMGSGVMQLIRQDFVRLVPKLPGWAGASMWWAVLSGGLLVMAGASIVSARKSRYGAVVLAALLVIVFLLYLPGLISNPGA